MIFVYENRRIDTERDLTAAERHIVQKMLAWKSVVEDLKIFREKTEQAFEAGWNHSGPVPPGDAMRLIIKLLEKDFRSI